MAVDGESTKVSVPLHDPSRPATVRVHLLSGSISVRGADVREVQIETGMPMAGKGEPAPPGMHRIGGSRGGLDAVESDNVVTIRGTGLMTAKSITLVVPRRTSLQLKTLGQGNISVEGVEGEADVNDLNGNIELVNISGAVVAHALNGTIKAVVSGVDASKPMSFSTMNGNIDVTLPSATRANVRMKTDNGEIFSDFDVKMQAEASAASEGRGKDGMSRVSLERPVRGTLNGGGPEYQFTSFNGQIYLRKK